MGNSVAPSASSARVALMPPPRRAWRLASGDVGGPWVEEGEQAGAVEARCRLMAHLFGAGPLKARQGR